MRLQLAIVAVAVAVAPSIPRPVGACSLVPPDGGIHELDPGEATDDVAPSAVTVTATLYQGSNDSGCSQSTCGDLPPSVGLRITATDDRTPRDLLGYRIRVVRGQPPIGIQLPGSAVRAFGDDIRLTHDDDDSIDFDLEIHAVDLNGNLGPSTVVTIRD
jgi:hypothetical protein